MGTYEQAFTEIYEILKYMPENIVSRIPESVLKTIKYNRDLNYDFKIDETKKFSEQKLSHKTYLLLAVIYRDFWAAPNRVKMIRIKERYKLEKEMKKLHLKYDPNNLFKKEG